MESKKFKIITGLLFIISFLWLAGLTIFLISLIPGEVPGPAVTPGPAAAPTIPATTPTTPSIETTRVQYSPEDFSDFRGQFISKDKENKILNITGSLMLKTGSLVMPAEIRYISITGDTKIADEDDNPLIFEDLNPTKYNYLIVKPTTASDYFAPFFAAQEIKAIGKIEIPPGGTAPSFPPEILKQMESQ